MIHISQHVPPVNANMRWRMTLTRGIERRRGRAQHNHVSSPQRMPNHEYPHRLCHPRLASIRFCFGPDWFDTFLLVLSLSPISPLYGFILWPHSFCWISPRHLECLFPGLLLACFCFFVIACLLALVATCQVPTYIRIQDLNPTMNCALQGGVHMQ
ncbi:hypothetical protein F4804DRAFT_265285 [Jackrogersella minutella]|nr:hypothetical protein F4804DRAFT_265285 [Jackrogersella minutella]